MIEYPNNSCTVFTVSFNSNNLLAYHINMVEGWDYETDEELDKIIEDNNAKPNEFEQEQSNKNLNKDTRINKKIISSSEYDKKFNLLDEPQKIIRVIKDNSRRALYNRDGTEFEDLIFVNSKTGEYKVSHISSKLSVKPTKIMNKIISNSEPYSIIGIHNHPHSTLPSGEDLYQCTKRKYKYGLIITHKGVIYKYTTPKNFSKNMAVLYNIKLEKNFKKRYNMNEFIEEVGKLFDVRIEVL